MRRPFRCASAPGSPATLVTAKELQRTIQDMKRQREEELIEQGVRIRDLNIRLDDTVAHKEQMSKDLQFTKSLLEDRQQTIDRLKAEVDRVEGQLQVALQPPSITVPSPPVTLQPPSITVQSPPFTSNRRR